MKSISKYAVVLAGVALTAGSALADEVVQIGPYGQGGTITFIKASPQTTNVALFYNRRGLRSSDRAGRMPAKPELRTTGTYGNASVVSYYAGDR